MKLRTTNMSASRQESQFTIVQNSSQMRREFPTPFSKRSSALWLANLAGIFRNAQRVVLTISSHAVLSMAQYRDMVYGECWLVPITILDSTPLQTGNQGACDLSQALASEEERQPQIAQMRADSIVVEIRCLH
jgi:hypothetical protein